MQTVTVLYFAVLRERRGRASEQVQVPDGATLRQVYEQIFPPGPQGSLPIGYARNREHASADDVVHDGDELAFLPPLGGG